LPISGCQFIMSEKHTVQSSQPAPIGHLLPVFTGVFAAVLVLIPSMSSKFIAVGPLSIAGSTLVFPITYIFNDVLTEVYGFRQSRIVIWTGMAMQILAAFFYWLIDILPGASFFTNQQAYHTILGQAPRIVIASLSAYFVGEFANSFVISKMKYHQGGRRGMSQVARFVWSTVVGEGFDSIIFMGVGFFGVIPFNNLLITILTIWSFKVLYEIVALPVSVRVSNWVKRAEGVDVIDHPAGTSYNPFSLEA
jgi:uncharacterized integral membrane protein (TIGR00697 family)